MPRCAASRCVKWVRWRSKPRGLSGRARQPAQVRRIARQRAQNLQNPACPRLRCVSHMKWSRQIAFAGKRAPTMPAGPSPWVRPRSAAPPLAHSRLKPVPQSAPGGSVGPASAEKRPLDTPSILRCGTCRFPSYSRSHNSHAVFPWDRLQPGRGQPVHHRFSGVAPSAFPAKTGPTVRTRCFSGTGISREEASLYILDSPAWHLAHSRLKPVPQCGRGGSVGPASAGKRPAGTSSILRRGT